MKRSLSNQVVINILRFYLSSDYMRGFFLFKRTIGMSEIDDFMKYLVMYCTIQQAGAMGWMINKNGNKITLKKKKSNMTKLDKNTSKLIDALFYPIKYQKD